MRAAGDSLDALRRPGANPPAVLASWSLRRCRRKRKRRWRKSFYPGSRRRAGLSLAASWSSRRRGPPPAARHVAVGPRAVGGLAGWK